jgi:hypothetical protein
VLDNEEDGPDLGDATLLAGTDFSEIVKSLPLDTPAADDNEHWQRLSEQPNITTEFVEKLRATYVGT